MYRAAVVGLGNIGFQFSLDPNRTGTWSHVSAYERCEETVLVGAVEIDEGRTVVFREHRRDIPVYKNVRDLMEVLQPQIVSICTPEQSHYQIAKEIVNYPVEGIFCEKPITSNIEDAKELVRLCSDRNVVLAVNHTRRWDDTYLYAQEMIEKGMIGTVKVMNAFYSGQIFNIGSHLIDVTRMLLQKNITEISGISNDVNKLDPDISGWIVFENNCVCTIAAIGKRENLIFEIDIIGEEGRIRILNNGENIEMYSFMDSRRYSGYRELSDIERRSIQKRDRFVNAVYDIVSVIRKVKNRVNCSGEDGLASLAICHGLVKSARRNGFPVNVFELLNSKHHEKE
ncbi:MAG TPA: Gfo/Idh/MocA family oxidoreductase [bacterium]|jgi:predicted dehydrogenase|nr:Gfo/Idh/MocA family oxidoreductase [Prolixibacteraceae bacterium]HOQ82202.1 Gfo/Idh/MocA family oxidoreductase [bacterium]